MFWAGVVPPTVSGCPDAGLADDGCFLTASIQSILVKYVWHCLSRLLIIDNAVVLLFIRYSYVSCTSVWLLINPRAFVGDLAWCGGYCVWTKKNADVPACAHVSVRYLDV